MDPRTGEILRFENEDAMKFYEKKIGRNLIPITEEQVKVLKPLSKRRRKALLAGMSCPCASGKSFKKCCWKKYQRKIS